VQRKRGRQKVRKEGTKEGRKEGREGTERKDAEGRTNETGGRWPDGRKEGWTGGGIPHYERGVSRKEVRTEGRKDG
jgi:hypothetical protein